MPAAGLLDHHRHAAARAITRAMRVQRAAEVAVAARLRDLLRGVQVDAQRVGLDALHHLAHRRGRQRRDLHRAEVGEQVDVGRGAPDLVGRRQLGVQQHRALAAEAERDAVRGGGRGERAVDLARRRRPAGHAGHHQRRADRPPEQRGRRDRCRRRRARAARSAPGGRPPAASGRWKAAAPDAAIAR